MKQGKQSFYVGLTLCVVLALMTLYDLYFPKEHKIDRRTLVGYHLLEERQDVVPIGDSGLMFFEGNFRAAETGGYTFTPSDIEPHTQAQREVSLVFGIDQLVESDIEVFKTIKSEMDGWIPKGTLITDIYLKLDMDSPPDWEILKNFTKLLREYLTLNYRLGVMVNVDWISSLTPEQLENVKSIREHVSFLTFDLAQMNDGQTEDKFLEELDKAGVPYYLIVTEKDDIVRINKEFGMKTKFMTGFMQKVETNTDDIENRR